MSTRDESFTPPPSEEEDKDPAWYRDQLAKKDAKIEDQGKVINRQRVHLMERTFEEIGLDPTKGLGKAIAEKYDGDPVAENLRNFAVENYQWEPPPDKVENPLGTTIAQAQARVDTAVAGAESSPVDPLDVQIAQAEEAGDFAGAVTLKMRKYVSTL